MLLGKSKLKYSSQIFAAFITFVVNNFMKNQFTTKSSARESDTVSGHTSKPYNNGTGKHLLLITCNVTSSEAVLPILPKSHLIFDTCSRR